MFLLDTDTLTHLHRGHPNVVKHVEAAADFNVGTTVITRIEMLRGRFESVLKASNGNQLVQAQEWLDRTQMLLDQLTTVGINEAAAKEFDKLRRRKKLNRIGRADLLIGCIALSRNATLVTRNLKHFRQIPNLRVENWMD